MAVTLFGIFGAIGGATVALLWHSFAMLLGFRGPTGDQAGALAMIGAILTPTILGIVYIVTETRADRRAWRAAERAQTSKRPATEIEK